MDIYMILLAIFLFLAAAALMVAEVFVPSAGLITMCAIACLVAGIAIFFTQGGPAVGWIGVGIAVVMLPTVWFIAYRLFPKTRFGKTVILDPPQQQGGGGIPDSDKLNSLLGAKAVVISPLRPVGMCDFCGQRLECVAESGYVEKGKTVQVIRVTGTQLTVRVVDNV